MDVKNNEAANQYEAWIEGERAGLIAYRKDDNVITYTRTKVVPAFGGQGVGSALALRALDDARAEGLTVVPLCPFVAAYIEKHPQYSDLVSA